MITKIIIMENADIVMENFHYVIMIYKVVVCCTNVTNVNVMFGSVGL